MKNKLTKWEAVTLSLAGIFQSALLVRELARKGEIDQTIFENMINSILKINADSVLEIYNGVEGVKIGLKALPNLLSKKTKKGDSEIIRYSISLIYLEKKFSNSPQFKKTLLRRIQQAQSQANHLAVTHPLVIDTLANAFLQSIAQFHYRIQVVGGANHLKNDEIVSKIRALLLAGIRSVVLWRQVGGSKWQLIFFRRKIIETAKKLSARYL
ncbi:MAG: hypothetical protein ACD_44C00201G0020 [uncultured bacterium]|nr:MAG: hypothetical protein ACD_44C00201G0020 [uncultured bacterium]OGT16173.1 MAG: lysogenization regulator HflD [Gammaproteobacteria bacterium RIFCSPHIGHO2_02_FULL_38_33]OGT23494.1 MAG: lysogenization regulator HflD [Gammaproteobacteria bacterium RIFCSPHIGHO2_12_38_15]OGT69590.1 MAG: lysogenization regulator HflD [Gammaproteobacteria bacterium RIFCSPLOWO2_02_FULL_38_11]OGT75436.1 MAG: lysogenization regulator HflD [Gammaproteobacteria bacterium RIFCSPLOWO2_12_FULL_38_14]